MSVREPKLLFISYFFPPAGGISCQRAVRFARYLARSGWDITVLTYGGTCPWRIIDPSLERKIAGIPTIRIPAPKIDRYFARGFNPVKIAAAVKGIFAGDVMSLWVDEVARRMKDIIAKTRPDLVFMTVPPFSQIKLVEAVKSVARDLPVIVDLRDLLWIINPAGNLAKRAANYIQKKALQKLVDQILPTADGITAPSGAIISRVERQTDIPTRIVPTPYDPEDFEGLPAYQRGEKFKILHSGRIYRSNRAEKIVDIFSLLPEDILARTELVLQGYDDRRTERICRGIGWITLSPTVPHGEALKAQRLADVNLAFVTESRERSGHLIIPGKVFDYIGAGRPILSIAPAGGALNTLVDRWRLGFAAPVETPALSAGVISKIFRLWESGELAPISEKSREKFSAPAVIPRLEAFLRNFL